MHRGGAYPVSALRRGGRGGGRHAPLQSRLQGWGIEVREVGGNMRRAREVEAHGNLLVARRGCARARFTGPVRLKTVPRI